MTKCCRWTPDWHQRVCAAFGGKVETSGVAETHEVLTDSADKMRLAGKTHAVAADMESAAVARVARDKGVSCLVIRAVVDPVSMGIPASALAAVAATGRRDWWGLCCGLSRRPREVFDVYQLGQAFSKAQKSLAFANRMAGPEFLAFGQDGRAVSLNRAACRCGGSCFGNMTLPFMIYFQSISWDPPDSPVNFNYFRRIR